MRMTTLHVDDEAFLLDRDVDIAVLRSAILAAARSGPAFVDFDTTRQVSISVLVSSETTIRFEVAGRSEGRDPDSDSDWGVIPSAVDFDLEAYAAG